MRRAVLLAVLAASPASASPWGLTAEVGAEVDTNVDRIETGPGLEGEAITAPVLRFGVRADGKDRLAGGAYALGLSDLTRIVDDSRASDENVTLLAGDLRWLHPVGERPVSVGFGITAADALPISDPVGAYTFVNLGADGVLAAHAGDDTRLTFTFGGRHFEYKPDHDFDWNGPSASARLDFMLWQPAAQTRSLELAATLGFDARFYDAYASADACPPHAPPDPMCFAPTSLARRDRFERAGIELTWVGRQVAAIGYQLTVIDSNSYGQSFARHRVSASVTTTLPGSIYASILGVLQIDRYLDGQIIPSDPVHTEFTNIDDESRSTLQLRLARKLSTTWSVEARAAAWRNIGNGAMEVEFHRELIYAGMMYSR